jgi:hypothetical protein
MVPQASLYPLVVQKGENEGEGEEGEPWTFWEKLIILAKFTRHAGFENTNTAVWRLAGNASRPHKYLTVTDNTVAAELDVNTLRVIQIYRPHLKLGQAAHFLAQPGAEAISINYRFRFDWANLGRIYIEERDLI